MKLLKRILILTVLAFCLENAGLYYLNKNYFKPTEEINLVKIDTPTVTHPDNTNKINLSEKAEKINVSYDGSYISYIEDSILKIMNLSTKEIQNVDPDKNMKLDYYEWLPDDNRLVIVERPSDMSNSYSLSLFSYDVKKKNKQQFIYFGKTYCTIDLDNVEEHVKNISFSSSNTYMCIQVAKTNGKSTLYSIDVMGEKSTVKEGASVTGTIEVIPGDTAMVYQADNSVYQIEAFTDKNEDTKYTGSYININGANALSFLDVDHDANIYIGTIVNGLVTSIYYGQKSADPSSWASISLPKPTASENIYVGIKGEVYVLDTQTSNVNELKSKADYEFKGKLIGVYSKGIVSIDNNTIIVKPFSK